MSDNSNALWLKILVKRISNDELMFSDFDNTHTDMQYMINLNNWVLLGICLVHSLG